MKARKHQVEALEAMNGISEGIIHLPTGTGKTFIQSLSIEKGIDEGWAYIKENNLDDIPVLTVLSPRIMLSNQLFDDIREKLLNKKLDCQYLIVHSGGKKDNVKRKWTASQPYRELTSTTNSRIVAEEYDKAKRENVPLIIFGTYDSAKRIMQSGIPVYMVNCDEAQYIVSKEFNWISKESDNEENPEKFFNAVRKYYYTATLKETSSLNGLGMNNTNLFGPIIYKKSPAEMINAGEIIRPRVHIIRMDKDVENDGEISNVNNDVRAIIESFREHNYHVSNIGAKLLVVAKGSDDLNDIVSHPRMARFMATRPNLRIFDISSKYEPRINGEIVNREVFLKTLQGLGDTDEAIIFHIDILSEGIDVPGITGVMPMRSLGLAKFMQTLGRATRLHTLDRIKLYGNLIKSNELEDFVKPYAWVILPAYDILDEDSREKIQNIIHGLRGYDFNASEDIVIRNDSGSIRPEPLGGLNEASTRAKALFEGIINISHEIESKEEASELRLEEFNLGLGLKTKSEDELIANILIDD